MAKLRFDIEKVKKLCDHAARSPDWSMGYESDAPRAPGLTLVGDEGVYLMSNGIPGLTKANDHHEVVYAEGCNPEVDEFDDWWSFKQRTFGGDDGSDVLPWAVQILKLMRSKPDARYLCLDVTPNSVGLVGLE